MAPVWLNAADHVAATLAREPVCDLAAAAPASVLPAFHTISGLILAVSLIASNRRRPFLVPSS